MPPTAPENGDPPVLEDDKTYDCPVFTWEEEDVMQAVVHTGPEPCDNWNSKSSKPTKQEAYVHGSTRIPRKLRLLVDTGAVDNLSGVQSIKEQSTEDAIAGFFKTEWETLQKPKMVSGVGGKANTCIHQAIVPGRLNNGMMITYATPVIPDDSPGHPSTVPSLYRLDSMECGDIYTYFGTRSGLMAMVSAGRDEEIIWPQGSRFMNCERAPPRHWLITANNWKCDVPNTSMIENMQTKTIHLHIH